jgi:hypothetical protein
MCHWQAEVGSGCLERTCGIGFAGFAAKRRLPEGVVRIGSIWAEALFPDKARSNHTQGL